MAFKKLSEEAKVTAELLQEVTVGGILTDQSLSDLFGVKVSSQWPPMRTALRIAQREAGAVFTRVRRVGYRRMDNGEVALSGKKSLKRIRRETTRGIKRVDCAVDEALPNDLRVKKSTDLAILGFFRSMTHAKRVASMAKMVADQQKADNVIKAGKQFIEMLRQKALALPETFVAPDHRAGSTRTGKPSRLDFFLRETKEETTDAGIEEKAMAAAK